MAREHESDDHRRGETLPEADRTGRHGVDPHSQPGEFADDMRVNRFTPPPAPEKEANDRNKE